MATLGDLVRLGRPHFLVGGVAFVVLAVALAWRAGLPLDPLDVALAQAAVTATQWGVHYGNEAHDADADRANPRRTRLAGGSGILPAGRASVGDAVRASHVLFAAGTLAAGGLAMRHPATAVASAAMLLLAWGYSAPPMRLCNRGLGELATGGIVAGLVPALVLIPAGASPDAWLPLLPLGLQVAALVLALSLPDLEGDAAAGKRTLAVRIGPRRTRHVLQAIWLACGLASLASVLWGTPPAFALAGGSAFTAAVALPMLVLRRAWDVLALSALAIVALQWGLTMLWALG